MHKIRSLWQVREHIKRKRRKVKLREQSEDRAVLVQIKTKQRDVRKTVKDEKGKDVENERYGKFYYETADTLELLETTPAEVKEAVLRGIASATKK